VTETRARAFGGAVGWNAAGTGASLLLGLFAAMVQTRGLGAAGYGQYAYLTWLAEAGGALGALGLPRPVARFVARLQRDQALDAAARMVKRAALWAVVGGGALGALVSLVPGLVPDAGGALRLLLPLSIAAIAAQAVIAAALQGGFGFRQAALANLGAASVLLLGSVAVARLHRGPIAQFSVVALSTLLSAVWGGFALRRLLKERTDGGPAAAAWTARGPFASYWKASAALTLIEMVVWQRSEVFFLNRFNTNEQAAFYTAAFAIAARLTVVPQLFAPVLQSTVAGLRYEDEAALMRRLFSQMTRWLALLCAPLYLIAAGLAPALARVLFGPGFTEAARPLAILLVGGLIPALAVPGSAIMYGTDRMGFVLRWGAAASVVTLTADLVLIPPYGSVGAAFANLSGQLFATVVTLALSLRPTGFQIPWLGVVRPVAAAALAGLAGHQLSALWGGIPGLLMGALGGALAYLVCLRVLRALEPSDDRLFDALAQLAPTFARPGIAEVGRWLLPPPPKLV
jgi:O-antigen/teichoic acid export membrane protein